MRLFWTLWRRRRLALIVGLTGFLVVFASAAIQPKKYAATALVMVSPGQARVVSPEQSLTADQPDSAAVETAIEMLRSPALAARVSAALKLESDPHWAAKSKGKAEAAGTESPIVEKLSKAVSVHRRSLSYIIEVTAVAPTAAQAASIANTLVESYQFGKEELRDTTMNAAGSWLTGRLEELRAEVQRKESAIAEYKATAGLLSSGESSLTEMQITNIQSSVLAARAELAEKVALYDQVAEASKRGASDTLGSALSSETMKELRAREADLTRKQADLEYRYTAVHPMVLNGKAELDNNRTRIAAELSRIGASAANEVAVARSRLQTLEGSLAGARTQLVSEDGAAVHLRELQREASATRAVYESFLKRYQEIAEQGKLGPSDAMLVSKARAPRSPESPKLAFSLVVAAFLGAAAAVASALLTDLLRDSLDPDVSPFGYPVLATIPLVTPHSLRLLDPSERSVCDFLVVEPFTRFAESYRKLRAALVFAPTPRPKVIAVASAMAGEGKSTTSLCLARTAALAGDRAILLDCDFRNPSTNEFFGIAPDQGLREVLLGKVSWRDVVGADARTGTHVIPSVAGQVAVEEIFSGDTMSKLLEELKGEYDLIVLNCPPVLLVADALYIAPHADSVLFVTHWERSARSAIRAALSDLQAAGASVAGITLNCVDFLGWMGGTRARRYYHQMPSRFGNAAGKQLTMTP